MHKPHLKKFMGFSTAAFSGKQNTKAAIQGIEEEQQK